MQTLRNVRRRREFFRNEIIRILADRSGLNSDRARNRNLSSTQLLRTIQLLQRNRDMADNEFELFSRIANANTPNRISSEKIQYFVSLLPTYKF